MVEGLLFRSLFVVGLVGALVACGDDTTGAGGSGGAGAGGGTTVGGAGGDAGSTTSSGGEGGAGGGEGCVGGTFTEPVCTEVEACEPGSFDDCVADLDQERCIAPACAGFHDAWLTCIVDLVEGAGWTECPDYPAACDAERTAFDDCAGT